MHRTTYQQKRLFNSAYGVPHVPTCEDILLDLKVWCETATNEELAGVRTYYEGKRFTDGYEYIKTVQAERKSKQKK